MPLCPQCSAEVSSSDRKCPSCGAEVNLTSDPTAVQDADHTPTRLKKTRAEERVHTTASGSGARFVAGHVLAGRYRIIGLIGRGGMGEVYKAEDLELDQTVALKFLPAELSKEEELLKRFRSEVRTARQVSHPNVCRVFDIGETEGLYYITMEYIEGDDLSMLLQRIGRLPSDKAVEISRQICLGLGAIHKAGILHRDLKPSNIIIDQKGEARITDFGIAGIEAEVQGEESRVGTPAYMSPEQITGKEVTKRSDIYSLGLLLYEIFTGKQAFEGSSVQELREKHTKETPTNPSQIVTGIDPVVEDLIERCLKKDPQERPDSALKAAMMLPGGNPLQVALEAGETPTPEMVAAAPNKGAIGRLAGLGLLLLFLASMFAIAYWKSTHDLTAAVPLDNSPEMLAKKAEEIVVGFGCSAKAADKKYRFLFDDAALSFIEKQENSKDWWNRLSTGQPAILYFRYRHSPKPMIPSDENGPVNDYDPALLAPGMVRITLDTTGRLLSFAAVPEKPSSKPDRKKADWKAIFEQAGLDITEFSESVPDANFIFEHDERAAWEGHLVGNPDIPVTVVGSALNGRPVEFKINAPWEKDESALGAPGKEPYPEGGILFIVFVVGVLIAAGLLARFNFRNGRGNLAGALKFGLFCSAAIFVSDVLSMTLTGSMGEDTRRLGQLIYDSPFPGVAAFVFYLGVEPVMRKRFPSMFISWNRLLVGNFKDPLIGRDLLIGLALGSVAAIGLELPGYLLAGSSNKLYLPFIGDQGGFLMSFFGYGILIANMTREVVQGLIPAFFYIFFLFLSSLVFKRKWPMVIFAAAVISLIVLPAVIAGEWLEVFILFSFNLLMLLCLFRFGYLAVTAFYVTGWLTFPSYVFERDSFLFPVTIFVLLVFGIGALIAYLSATAGQPWIKGRLRDELGG